MFLVYCIVTLCNHWCPRTKIANCNTYMQTQHTSKTGIWYSWYWIWLKNNLIDIHTWTAHLFAKAEYITSEYIKCTDYNVGISCMVIYTCTVLVQNLAMNISYHSQLYQFQNSLNDINETNGWVEYNITLCQGCKSYIHLDIVHERTVRPRVLKL
jgi:hypothetical protein